ncbi:MAG: glutamine--fructose-6-phosphate transaminase (isomerizing) [Paracoccaceae bacterium]
MCGIIALLSNNEVAPVLVEGLKRLEYRGYDSAGIATINNGKLERRRAVGKLVNLSDMLVHEPLAGKTGIGHTRWATHGAPTQSNCHPHRSKRVAVVHNGIIENYKDLRAQLAQKGVVQTTETDTELVALMFEQFLDEGHHLTDAFHLTIDALEGAYALAFLVDGEQDMLLLARKACPLAIGHGNGEAFAGSDAIALAPLTDRITYLEDGDRAILTRSSVLITNEHRQEVTRSEQRIIVDDTRIDKAGYKHFMAKEIAEQPTVLHRALRAYLHENGKDIALPCPVDFSKIQRLKMVACGTAYLAAHVAKYWFEDLARLPVEIDIASEFRYREPPIESNCGAIFISQSGETADTLAAFEYARHHVPWTMGITNVASSTLGRQVEYSMPIHAGVEVCVASTKAFTCQLMVMAVMAIKAGLDRGELTLNDATRHLNELRTLTADMHRIITQEALFEGIAKDLAQYKNALFLGRGSMYPIALEGALKLKELSYIHAEGYASGELKHGPIALVDNQMPIVVVAPKDDLFEKTVSNMQEVIARGGKVILVSDRSGIEEAGHAAQHHIMMPSTRSKFAAILYAVPMQMIAYHTALSKGTDIDQPRNLAKSVTVE